MTTETVVPAFLGAALAFVFFLGGEVFVRAYERSTKHYNALVRIERLMNELLDVINVQIKQIKGYRLEDGREIKGYRATVEDGKVINYPPRPLPLDPDILPDLYDVRVVNKMLSLHGTIKRANNDIETIRHLYDHLASRFIERQIDVEAYKKNAAHIVKASENLASVLENATLEEIKDLLLEARVVLAKPRPIGIQIVAEVTNRLFVAKYVPTIEEKQEERRALEAEIAIVRAESLARLRAGGGDDR